MPDFGTKKTIIEVGYRELEALIKDVYGHEIELVAEEEWNNDEQHTFVADPAELTTWDERDLARFKEAGVGSFGITDTLLKDLVRLGRIEKGEYLVNVSW